MTAMKTNPLPTIEYLAECFDLVGGSLVWRKRPRHHFNTDRGWTSFNAVWPGKRAGRTMHLGDYRQIGISGVRYLEHRIIAFIAGIDTGGLIDHKDGCGLNNTPSNLRRATKSQNCANTSGWKKRTLRVGVYLVKNGKFAASCRVNGKLKHLGTFKTYEEAVIARVDAEKAYYGEFAFSNRGSDEQIARV